MSKRKPESLRVFVLDDDARIIVRKCRPELCWQ
jgi:hypothetical protein